MRMSTFLFALTLSGAFYARLAETDRLVCDRKADSCTLTQTWIYRATTRTFPARDLLGASLRSAGGRRHSPEMRIVLTTPGEAITFTESPMEWGSERQRLTAGAIYRYAHDATAGRLDVSFDNHVRATGLALVMLAVQTVIVVLITRRRRAS